MLEMSPLWNIQLRSMGGKKPQKWQPENNNNKSHYKPRFRQADGIEMSRVCVCVCMCRENGYIGDRRWGGEAEGVNPGHSAQPVH